MNRIMIVTGAAGHLAGTILRELRGTEYSVRGLVMPGETPVPMSGVAYYTGDVTKPGTLEEIFTCPAGSEVTVIHVAGLISIASRPDEQLRRVNVDGTRNIIDQCLRHGARRLVYVCSVHALPETPGSPLPSAAGPDFRPDEVRGAYAKTKAAAGQAVLDAVRDRGLDAVIVLPSGILGPFDSGRNHMVQMLKTYAAGRLPLAVKGGYDFVDVRDVARGCIAAAERGVSGECYILSNRYYTIAGLLAYAREALQGRKTLSLPIPFVRCFAPFCELAGKLAHRRPLFTAYSLRTLRAKSAFPHEKAAAQLGYAPRDMRQTVCDTLRWLAARPGTAEGAIPL